MCCSCSIILCWCDWQHSRSSLSPCHTFRRGRIYRLVVRPTVCRQDGVVSREVRGQDCRKSLDTVTDLHVSPAQDDFYAPSPLQTATSTITTGLSTYREHRKSLCNINIRHNWTVKQLPDYLMLRPVSCTGPKVSLTDLVTTDSWHGNCVQLKEKCAPSRQPMLT